MDTDGAATQAARTAAAHPLGRATGQVKRQEKGGVTALPVNKTKPALQPTARDSLTRPGGRFWVLAGDAEDQDDREEASADSSELAIPSPIAVAGTGDTISCFKTNTPKKARQRILRTAVDYHKKTQRRMTGASSIRPWHGPIPKVSLQTLTIADCIHPNAWITVRSKKKRPVPVTAEPTPVVAI
ncbi:hypothetical protein ZWY2020_046200 [Hordeum vulgare]|nr:hypothetical protein ZWY2020_046200 [Hordeum vulgare]